MAARYNRSNERLLVDKILFTIHGNPRHQQRHRHTNTGGFVRTYDPSSKDKSDFLIQAKYYAPKIAYTGVIYLTAWFCMKRPKSHYGTGKNQRKLKSSAPFWHTSKPDVDNLLKFVMDALNKVFWKDDSQVVSVIAQKRYDEKPRTIIQIDYK